MSIYCFSEVINGKIWSTPADIEQKLVVMTDHISNVTQRCLQGKYNNIYEYNSVAEQNAEAYQVLMEPSKTLYFVRVKSGNLLTEKQR